MIRVIHPTGNSFVRALLQGLAEEDVPFEFWTTIAANPRMIPRWFPSGVKEQLNRRAFDVPRGTLRTQPWREWARLLGPSLALGALTRHERGWASVDAVYRALDAKVARHLRKVSKAHQGGWVYGYEDGAAASFEAAAELGIKRAYELPIAHWQTSRKLLAEEAERWPAWAATLVGPSDSDEKLERKDRELRLAEVVVVPSVFVRNSLPAGIEVEKKVVVAEFGTPIQAGAGDEAGAIPGKTNRKMRLLFAGSMSQRKGLADLFEAMRLLQRNDVELVIMGSPVVAMEFYQSQKVPFVHEPPRPQAKVFDLMRTCDVLVLPSIVEGRALVQQEAMACGLPVVATPNAGCEDLVIDGETGFLVPIRSPQTLAARIDWFAAHRSDMVEMGREAKKRAACVTWERYRKSILGALGLAHDTLQPEDCAFA